MDKTIFIFDSRNNIFLNFFANITKNKILKQMNRKIFIAWKFIKEKELEMYVQSGLNFTTGIRNGVTN